MNLDEIINRIGMLRIRANLSARALSFAIDKNDSYINRLETRRNFEPSLSTLLDIIKACNSTPEEFFYENVEQYQTDKECIRFLKALSKKQKEAVMSLYK
jgi:transcriptional regulator with XRE-family HTH domain